MDTAFIALIPVNRLDRAKGRLAEVLSPQERADLAVTTMRTVIEAVVRAGGHSVVLTADDAVIQRLDESAELLREDPNRSGLNAQLEFAQETMATEELLILHADLPLAKPEALQRIVRGAPPAPSATIVRSPDGGTNVMFQRPSGSFPLHYGADSAALHRKAALTAGITFSTRSEPSLVLDLDTPEDLATLLQSETGRESPAGRLLQSWRIRERLQQASG